MKPTIVLIQGLPAAGKTTLGRDIAKRLSFPFFSKDDFKERVFDSCGFENADDALSKKLGAMSFEVTYCAIEACVSAGVSCVAETFWSHAFAEPALRNILKQPGTQMVQVFVKTDDETRSGRFKRRYETNRHQIHQETDLKFMRMELSPDILADNVPLNLPGPVIEVDTTDFSLVDIDAIVSQIQTHL